MIRLGVDLAEEGEATTLLTILEQVREVLQRTGSRNHYRGNLRSNQEMKGSVRR